MPRIQHVSIPMPPDHEAEARRFFGELLGLTEVAVPQGIAHLRLIWYKLGDTELHVFTDSTPNDRSGRHLCLEVDNLAELRARLDTAGYAPYNDVDIPGRPRFFCRDPFGNLIEVLHIEDDYLKYQ